MSGNLQKNLTHAVLPGLLLVYAIWLFSVHVNLVKTPIPLDVYESAMPFITALIAEGGNPYSFENQPLYTNVYPPLYNLLSVPLTWIYEELAPLSAYRALAGLYILLSCLVVYVAARKEGATPVCSALAGIALYTVLLYFSTPAASSSSIGLLSFLLCVSVPRMYSFSPAALVASAAFGIVAFYGKQYFLAGPAFVALYLLLFESRSQALIYATGTGIALSISAAIVFWTSPYYFDNTLFAVQAAAGVFRNSSHLWLQLSLYLKIYSGLAVALLISRVAVYWRREWPPWSRPGYYWVMFVLASLVIVLVLGHSPGNHMTYLFQLMSPFLLIAAAVRLSQTPAPQWLLLPPVVFTLWQGSSLLDTDLAVDMQPWQRIEQEIQAHQHIYAEPMFLQLIREQRKPVYRGPLSQWFHFALLKPSWAQRAEGPAQVRQITDAHIARINRWVATQHFDLVLLRRGDYGMIGAAERGFPFTPGDGQAAFKANYHRDYSLDVPLPPRRGGGVQHIEVWKPLNR